MAQDAASNARYGDLSALVEELARAPAKDAASAWSLALRPGDLVDCRFEILRELGRGGFGTVYEALDRELGRKVALKTLRPGKTATGLAKEEVRREAQAAARLSHPGIVTLYEACACDRGPYLVMELLRGETLEARLGRGPVPVRDAVEIALQTARALEHVHSQGLIHRDLKPGNLFLCHDGRVRLLDLGLAHLLGADAGRTGGTPAYVAPEQWRGEAVDGRADVFALGAVLVEMLSGAPPRSAAGEPGADVRGRGGPPALPRGIPLSLSTLVGRCVAREPQERPTAAEVSGILVEVQRRLERPRDLPRAALAIAVAAALALGTAAAWLGFSR